MLNTKYRYGKKIWDKIQGAMYPEFEDEIGINPFDMWEGANFKLKIRKVAGYRNYDKSEFDSVSQLAKDEVLETIYEQEHLLQPLVAEDQFKSYEELDKQLHRVLGDSYTGGAGNDKSPTPAKSEYSPTRKPRSTPAKEEKGDVSSETGSSDDDLDFFESLAEK